MEVVAKRNPQRVPKVFVIGRHLTQGGQQMPNMAGARTPCQGIGRSASNLQRAVAQPGEHHLRFFWRPVFLRGSNAPGVHSDQFRLVTGQAKLSGFVQLAKAMEHPGAVRLQFRLGNGPGHRLAKRLGGALADVIGEIVGGGHSAGKQRAGQLADRLAKRRGREVDRLGQALALWAVVNQAPNPARLAIAPGVVEAHLVVADDAVVKIGDVQRAVGAELQIDRPEPRVAGAD